MLYESPDGDWSIQLKQVIFWTEATKNSLDSVKLSDSSCIHEQSMNHTFQGRQAYICYAMSLIMEDTTGRWELLFNAQNLVRWLALFIQQVTTTWT